MAEKKNKGAGSRFLPKTGIAKYREWRGLKDTAYDYLQWLGNVGIMGGFLAKSPVRILRGMLEYRWFGSYLGAFHMIDRCMEGLRGPALRAAHTQMHAIMKGSTDMIADMMKGDRRFGETEYAGKLVLLEQTMCPEIIAGFPGLKPMPLEVFQGLLGCYMDQQLSPFYMDIMENVGLPADSCRLSANAAGVAINDDYAVTGACLITNNMPCDSSTMNSQLIERRVTVPSIVAGIPMRWEDEHTDKYALWQMKRVIRFIEEQTGEHFDQEAFFKTIRAHNREVRNELEKWEYMKTLYSPYGLVLGSLFHAFYFTFSGGRLPYCGQADRKTLKIAEKAYREKTNCFPKARHRMITWGGPGCYFLHLPNWLYNCWGVLVVAQMDNFSGNYLIDEENLDQALLGIAHNYERGVMRRHLTGGYGHLLEFWDEAEKFNCDMVLMYDDITCKGAMGMAGMVNDQAKDRDIHLMWVQNDMFDHRTISRNQMRKQINDYMTAVMQEQPLDASLLDIDDYEGW